MDKEPALIDLKGVPCSGDKELAPRDIKGAVQMATKNLATSVGPMDQSSTKKRRLPLVDAATAPRAILGRGRCSRAEKAFTNSGRGTDTQRRWE